MSGRRSAERRGQAAEKNDAVRAKVAAVVVVLALLLLAACAASVWLKGGDDAPGEAPAAAGAGTASDDEVDELAGAAEEAVSEEPSTVGTASGSASAVAPSGSAATGGLTSSSAQESSSSGASSGRQPAAKPSHEHSWTAVTGQRWVVDQAAWDEDVYKDTIICDCGLSWSSTWEWDDHNKQLMLNGGGCGHRVQSSYVKTIHHDEVGHYETVTTGHRCSCGATK